jgi:N-acetyl-gamma-glutamyl-phosphate reductase
MNMLSAAIIGAAGYTGGELLRLLLTHPAIQNVEAVSASHMGKSLCAAHPDLLSWRQQTFVASLTGEPDVIFLCGGHGESRRLLDFHQLYNRQSLIIDLSQDFRLQNGEHDFAYGLPEAFAEQIVGSRRIANPGCFATALQLALLPLAQAGWLHEEVHITGVTGSTGAGQKLQDALHFSWRHDNLSVYKAFEHQHLHEIRQTLQRLQPSYDKAPLFIPMRGPFTRGILVSMHTACRATLDVLTRAYDVYYENAPFVHRTDGEANLKQVLNTNNAVLSVEKYGGYAHIVCCLDNLLKGASGQAVHNMNLALGLPETMGLELKPSAF